MNVDSIKNGIVIDHIKAGQGMEIYRFLELDRLDCPVAIIKIDTDQPLDISALGYIDSALTVNIIKDGKKVEKFHPELPLKIVDIVPCKNPRCITSTEQELPHIFRLTNREKGTYRCIYCDSSAKKNI